MKNVLLALAILSSTAQAETFFQAEVGLGVAKTQTLGDGIWYQEGVPHTLKTITPALLIGATGTVYRDRDFDVGYHLDYTFVGNTSASCLCVADPEYNAQTHQADRPGYLPFNGFGHLQGFSLTVEPGYTYRGVRFAAEAGPWVFWQTWHESALLTTGAVNASHKPVAQVSYVVGARIEYKGFSLSYRYYNAPQKWNPYPGLAGGAHILMGVYKF
jgi:hypothetical protein